MARPSPATLQRIERNKLVLWRKPFHTLYFAFIEFIYKTVAFILSLSKHKVLLFFASALAILGYYGYITPSAYQQRIQEFAVHILWYAYWVGLGVLSSIGFGTGLHTFVLYLGPFIAKVTLAAFECNSLDFPQPPYPNEITCPGLGGITKTITLWSIINKVRLESLAWGAGTALGELPPYFMARAARLSSQEPDDEEYREYIAHTQGVDAKKISYVDRLKMGVEKSVLRVGFFGILACASIPNPLFDLAGIICGHSLISFWTFFGATLIGKALIKAHLQTILVIVTFSEHHFEDLINLVKKVPVIGNRFQFLLRDFLNEQKRHFYRNPGDPFEEQKTSIIQLIFSWLVILMIVWYVCSIINSLAQAYDKRICRVKNEAQKKKT